MMLTINGDTLDLESAPTLFLSSFEHSSVFAPTDQRNLYNFHALRRDSRYQSAGVIPKSAQEVGAITGFGTLPTGCGLPCAIHSGNAQQFYHRLLATEIEIG